jgi:hypothetical protein
MEQLFGPRFRLVLKVDGYYNVQERFFFGGYLFVPGTLTRCREEGLVYLAKCRKNNGSHAVVEPRP